MPLLYFWRGDNYRRDLDMGAGYNLNQANPLLHSIDIGDSLWAFTRNRLGEYVLAAELVVSAKTRNPKTFRYGSYRIWGSLEKSRYFLADGQPSVEPVIRNLSCNPRADLLGQSFQGRCAVRAINLADHRLLRAFSQSLPQESRARLIPEEELEEQIAQEAAQAFAAYSMECPTDWRASGSNIYTQSPRREADALPWNFTTFTAASARSAFGTRAISTGNSSATAITFIGSAAAAKTAYRTWRWCAPTTMLRFIDAMQRSTTEIWLSCLQVAGTLFDSISIFMHKRSISRTELAR